VFTDSDFPEVLNLSLRHPVVLLLTMDSAPETHALTDSLVRLTNQAAGRWLLAKVDVQASPQVAAALQVRAVPMVVAFIGGQVAPLFQGTKPETEISALLQQVVQAAVAGGITGRAQPVPGGLTAAGAGADAGAEADAADPAAEALPSFDTQQAAELLKAIREHTDERREAARKQLLELFAAADPKDPAVSHARRELAAALF
jgi:putative thioredoxin